MDYEDEETDVAVDTTQTQVEVPGYEE